jgi:hypothetical protein
MISLKEKKRDFVATALVLGGRVQNDEEKKERETPFPFFLEEVPYAAHGHRRHITHQLRISNFLVSEFLKENTMSPGVPRCIFLPPPSKKEERREAEKEWKSLLHFWSGEEKCLVELRQQVVQSLGALAEVADGDRGALQGLGHLTRHIAAHEAGPLGELLALLDVDEVDVALLSKGRHELLVLLILAVVGKNAHVRGLAVESAGHLRQTADQTVGLQRLLDHDADGILQALRGDIDHDVLLNLRDFNAGGFLSHCGWIRGKKREGKSVDNEICAVRHVSVCVCVGGGGDVVFKVGVRSVNAMMSTRIQKKKR